MMNDLRSDGHLGSGGRLRPQQVARGVYGVVLLAAPAQVLTAGGARAGFRSRAVVRVLGTRQVVQAILSGVRPGPKVLALGVWVDLAHAASAVGLALVDRTRSRAALVDTVLTLVWAGLGWRALGRVAASDHECRRDRAAMAVLRHTPGATGLLRRRPVRR